MSPFDLSDRVALVTGSSRGIGRTLAIGLAEAGASVVLHGRDEARLSAAASELRARYGDRIADAVAFDVMDEAAVVRHMAQVQDRHGRIDILVNNAGVQHREPLLELAAEDWDRVLRNDLTSAFLVAREAARGMVRRRRGKIINISSIQSDLARPGIAPYTAAKGGVRNLTRAMCAEWAGENIQVNAIAPGYLDTEMTRALVEDPEFNAWVVGRTPARRWGSPSDVAGVAVWLASAASDFVNGQTIHVDGGMSVVV